MSSKTPPEEYIEVSDAVRSGEYFREAAGVYDALIHEPMSERYFYLFITGLSALILLITFIAMQNLYPLKRSVPFIVSSDNLANDLPTIRTLINQKGQDPSMALLKFMAANYVKDRESYDIEKFDRNMNGVRTQSTEEVFAEYQNYVDPRNPESPITLFQRHSTKSITILDVQYFKAGDQETVEVLYESLVKSKSGRKKSRWQANVSFIYSGIELDKKTDTVKPVTFIVTDYKNKLLQDIQ